MDGTKTKISYFLGKLSWSLLGPSNFKETVKTNNKNVAGTINTDKQHSHTVPTAELGLKDNYKDT